MGWGGRNAQFVGAGGREPQGEKQQQVPHFLNENVSTQVQTVNGEPISQKYWGKESETTVVKSLI